MAGRRAVNSWGRTKYARMIYLQVTYRLRSDRLDEGQRKILAFDGAIRNSQPRFVMYHIFRETNDGASFVHFMSFRNHEDQLEHMQLPHVKHFVETMLALCEAGPIYSELQQVADTDTK
jgi:quinol monooxygenase YgiN